jgi:hypothetical protein
MLLSTSEQEVGAEHSWLKITDVSGSIASPIIIKIEHFLCLLQYLHVGIFPTTIGGFCLCYKVVVCVCVFPCQLLNG